MSAAKLQSDQRKYLRDRIARLFGEAQNTIGDRAILRRQAISREMLESKGVARAKEEAEAILAKIEVHHKKLTEENGKFCDQIAQFNERSTEAGLAYKASINTVNVRNGSPFSRAVDAEFVLTPEGSNCAALSALHKEIEDRLMLNYEGKTGFEILKEVEMSIATIVGAQKSLTSGKEKK